MWRIISCYNRKCKTPGTEKLPDDSVLLHGLRADAVVPDQPENDKKKKKRGKVKGSIWSVITVKSTRKHLVIKRFLLQKLKDFALPP